VEENSANEVIIKPCDSSLPDSQTWTVV